MASNTGKDSTLFYEKFFIMRTTPSINSNSSNVNNAKHKIMTWETNIRNMTIAYDMGNSP